MLWSKTAAAVASVCD